MGLFAFLVELGLDAVSVEVLLVELRMILAVVFVDVGGCGGGSGCGTRNWALLRLLEVVDLLFSLYGRSVGCTGGCGGARGEGCCGRYRWDSWDIDGTTGWSRVKLFLGFFGLLNGKLKKCFLAEGVRFERRGVVLVLRDKGREFLDGRGRVVITIATGNGLIAFVGDRWSLCCGS